MKGTEKQIKWAEDIRNNMIATCDANIARFADTIPEDAAIFSAIRERCIQFLAMCDKQPETESASWWIENRTRMPNPIKIFEAVKGMIFNGKTVEQALKSIFG